MADLSLFSSVRKDSALHRLDVRCKLMAVCLVGASLLSARLPAALTYALVLVLLMKKSGLHLFSSLGQMKYFLVLLLFVVAARALSVSGDILFSFYSMTITQQGVDQGLLTAFKFLLVMLTGILFSATTKPSSVKAAVQWFLKPIPLVPEKQVAVMVSLALGFMPIILKQANAVSDAQKARCGDLEKNPVKRIIRFVFPLLKKTFLTADLLVMAMESRCYTEDRTDPEFTVSGQEIYFLTGSLALCFGFLWL
jgi:energy-coupling factor transporter transmembrane protein EcfT